MGKFCDFFYDLDIFDFDILIYQYFISELSSSLGSWETLEDSGNNFLCRSAPTLGETLTVYLGCVRREVIFHSTTNSEGFFHGATDYIICNINCDK